MAEKFFFRRDSIKDILEREPKRVANQHALMENLSNCDFPLALSFLLIPGYYYAHRDNSFHASLAYLKNGNYLEIKHPRTLSSCVEDKKTFYNFFLDSLERSFDKLDPSENKFLGYFFQPGWGDRRARRVSFNNLLEGLVSFLYFKEVSPIDVDDRYVGSDRNLNGAQIIVSVPSKREKERRYKFKFIHVPFHNIAEQGFNLANSLNIEVSSNPLEGFTRPLSELYMISYPSSGFLSSKSHVFFLSHDIAAYFAIVEKQKKIGNTIPEKFSPFPFPSACLLNLYWNLRNNCVTIDYFTKKPRLLHQSEISRVISWFIQNNGNLENLFLKSFIKEEYRSFIRNEIQKNLES